MTGEVDKKFEELCTLALETEGLNLRDRAGTLVNRGVFKLRRQEYTSSLRDFDAALKRDPTIKFDNTLKGLSPNGVVGRLAPTYPSSLSSVKSLKPIFEILS